MSLVEKVQTKLLSFKVWCILSGADEIFGLLKKTVMFLFYFIASGVLVFAGHMKLQEIRGNDPLSYFIFFIGISVVTRGAIYMAKDGFV